MLSRHFVKRGVLSYKHRVVRYVHTKNGSLGLSVADIKRESSPLNKTKIICTMGPACWSVEGITTLIDAGMNVARFNFSHGNHSSHLECLDRLKTALIQRPSAQVAVLLGTVPYIYYMMHLPKMNKFQTLKDQKFALVTWRTTESSS